MTMSPGHALTRHENMPKRSNQLSRNATVGNTRDARNAGR